ncbi:MAG: hypothetical protein WC475_00920 [Candidatus Paceibacterota bacterium]
MKIFIISLATIVLIGVLAVIGYSIYHKNQTPEGTGESNPTLEVVNYQIPSGEITTLAIQPAELPSFSQTPVNSQTSQTQSGPIPPESIIPPAISQNYAKFYQESINNLNKIPPDIGPIQETLLAIEEAYQNNDMEALTTLVAQGTVQNAVLSADIANLKTSLDGWLTANDQTNDAAIKAKTAETIENGKVYTQASFEFSDALGKIFAYTGEGDLEQLVAQLQTTAQNMSNKITKLNNSFTELNNLLTEL